ncbi:MAG: hypothetical protein HFG26_02690 [Provencibacterium sp.]|jgi:hypothetical protein|nr:hypothetical protein [Provencibacterium sp.]
MAKSYKIKRYRHIYRRRRFSPFKTALLLLLLAVLAFVGFSIYEPVRDFWSGQLLQRMEASSVSESEPEPLPPSSDPSESEPENAEAEPHRTINGLHAVYIPEEVLLSGQAVSYLESLTLPDVNTALIDLKNAEGRVLYQSQVELASTAGIQQEGAIDLAATIASLQAAGYQTAGRIHAFRDALAPYADKAMAVQYGDTGWTWLDNTEEAGGRPWLNPYSSAAQEYIRSLALEAAGMGLPLLFIEAIQFPEGYGRDQATFGSQAAEPDKAALLRTFTEGLKEDLKNQGTTLIPCVSGPQLLGQDVALPYDGVNPSQIFTSPLSVKMMPALFGEVFEVENFRLQAPVTTPFETVRAVAGKAVSILPKPSTIIPWLQGYTDWNFRAEFTKPYTQEDLDEQIRALTEVGLDSYVVVY